MFNPLNMLRKTPEMPEGFVALDFGTTTTKAFIFSLGEKVELRGQGRGTAEEAVAQALNQADIQPTQAVVGIGGENVWCLTTTVRLNRSHPEEEVKAEEEEKLRQQIFRIALMQATTQMSQFTNDPELTLELIDSEVLNQKVDGQVLEASIFTAHSPTTYLQQLNKNLKKLNLNLWAVCSLMSILVKALANNEPRNFNAIILDIGGRMTDVAVVFGGGIWGNRPLPLGGEDFDLSLWLSGVEIALADFEGVKTFPNRIIVTGGGAQIEGLKEGLLDYPLTRALPFVSQPVVEVRTDVGPQSMKLVGQEILGDSNAD
jgi:cell division protein FtsA